MEYICICFDGYDLEIGYDYVSEGTTGYRKDYVEGINEIKIVGTDIDLFEYTQDVASTEGWEKLRMEVEEAHNVRRQEKENRDMMLKKYGDDVFNY